MTISCPSCGLAFETKATTNTRCRRCKVVVRIGSGPLRPRATPRSAEPATDELTGGVLAVSAFVALALVIVVPPIVLAIRRRRAARSGALATDGAEGADRATTGADGQGLTAR